MKRSLLIIVLICFAFIAKAQIPVEKLLGTWTLIKYDYGNGKTGDLTKTKFKKIKIFTPQTFTVLDFDTTWSDVKTVLMGGYQLNYYWSSGIRGSIVGSSGMREHVISGSAKSNYKKLGEFFSAIRIDEDNIMYVTGKKNDIDISETWLHIKEQSSPPVYEHSVADDLDTLLSPSRKLYILKTKDKEIRVRQNKEYPAPFASLPNAYIAEVDLVNDGEGIYRYGMDARFGVLIIKVREKYLPELLAKFRKQKNID